MEIKINGDTVHVSKERYKENNRIALVTEKDSEPYAVITVNLPDVYMEEDEIAIDVNNIREGIIEQLVSQSIIDSPAKNKWVQSGYVKYPICKLLI